jgi:para-nitrobenzyl esterase
MSRTGWFPRKPFPVALLAALGALFLGCSTSNSKSSDPLKVQTTPGALRGITLGEVDEFLGVPYAAPPVGDLRFRPPQPVAPWEGELNARAQHDTCSQTSSNDSPEIVNEDCLYLNIYRPKGTSASARLPVLFHIHGGGNIQGRANNHDGTQIALTNDMIVVMVEYRLNAFGFLALPSLTSESSDHSSGNYALLDQQAALRWLHDNIAAFGGDPENVTISGQSAGGVSVCAHLASPTAAGLFHRAIIMSGSCVATPLADAEATGAILAAKLGCDDEATAASCLRGKPAADVLQATADMGPMKPTAGGDVLPVTPGEAVASGAFNLVPVMMGTTHDEWRAFGFSVTDEASFQGLLTGFSSAGTSFTAADIPDILEEYPLGDPPQYTAGAAMTDSGQLWNIGGCPQLRQARAFAAHTPTFFYEFNDAGIPPQRSLGTGESVPVLAGLVPGAYHAGDLAYTVGFALMAPLSPGQQALSDEIVKYWGAFAAGGAPIVAGQAAWPAFDAQDQALMSYEVGGSRQLSGATFAEDHRCSFWDGLLAP